MQPFSVVSVLEPILRPILKPYLFLPAPAIYELTANSKDFISGDLPSFYLPLITDVDEVVNQFNGKWEHTNKPVGNVVKVSARLKWFDIY
jgi:hypothetical protein